MATLAGDIETYIELAKGETNAQQKEELLKAYRESFDGDNLLSHEQIKLQHEKWLKS